MGEDMPAPITQASFQSANNYDGVLSKERQRRRAETRGNWLPPGLIAQQWVVGETFFYKTGIPGEMRSFTVPAGYEFDGASVPFPLTVLVPQTHSLYLAAAALHDWLYENAHEELSRKEADAIFREAMMVTGLNWIWAGLMWRAVRAGGWAVWNRRKPESWIYPLLQAPWLIRAPLVFLITMAAGFGAAIFVDLPRLCAYRRQGKRIAERDES